MDNSSPLPPDAYPLPPDDPRAGSQQLLSNLLAEAQQHGVERIKSSKLPAGQHILGLPKPEQVVMLEAALERMKWLTSIGRPLHRNMQAAETHTTENLRKLEAHQALENVLGDLIATLSGRKLPYTEPDLLRLVELAADLMQPEHAGQVGWGDLSVPVPGLMPALATELESIAGERPLSKELLAQTQRLHAAVKPLEFWAGFKKTVQRLETLLEQKREGMPDEGEPWAESIRTDMARMKPKLRAAWLALLENAPKGTTARPTAKWRKQADELLAAVGPDRFAAQIELWFGLVGLQAAARIQPRNASLLRALVWYASLLSGETVCRALANAVEGGLRKLPQGGLYASSISKACITALESMPGVEPVAQLSRLKYRVKSPWGQEETQKALAVAVQRSGMSAAEVEEISVPTFGLETGGVLRKQLGEHAVELRVAGTHDVAITWLDKEGKALPKPPSDLKKSGNEPKALKRLASDIEKMLGAQRDRIERLYHTGQTWTLTTWRQRYLDHPLLGEQSRRLIWQFTEGKQSAAGIWQDGGLVQSDGSTLDWLTPATRVQLWHPLGVPASTVQAWREWLETKQVTQPFKQAHREIYLLTAAEERTQTYSNRFAAHILRQHQFKALCDARGWRFEFLGSWDGDNNGAALNLPHWGMQAHFWVHHAGDELSASGVAVHVSSDQVRFSDEEVEALPLANIPVLAFSEVMRDVDLFVGVCSIGADPAWQDGGDARYHQYWHAFSFGELGTSAEVRRELLQRLVPKLKIAKQCSFENRFLVIRGTLRTYKIHLGSGNILMSPNDQYLCIVPDMSSKGASGKIFLPFEGDRTLAIILSKAFLLAEDDQIKDVGILRQIQTG